MKSVCIISILSIEYTTSQDSSVIVWSRSVFIEFYIIETAYTKLCIVGIYDVFHWPIHK